MVGGFSPLLRLDPLPAHAIGFEDAKPRLQEASLASAMVSTCGGGLPLMLLLLPKDKGSMCSARFSRTPLDVDGDPAY